MVGTELAERMWLLSFPIWHHDAIWETFGYKKGYPHIGSLFYPLLPTAEKRKRAMLELFLMCWTTRCCFKLIYSELERGQAEWLAASLLEAVMWGPLEVRTSNEPTRDRYWRSLFSFGTKDDFRCEMFTLLGRLFNGSAGGEGVTFLSTFGFPLDRGTAALTIARLGLFWKIEEEYARVFKCPIDWNLEGVATLHGDMELLDFCRRLLSD